MDSRKRGKAPASEPNDKKKRENVVQVEDDDDMSVENDDMGEFEDPFEDEYESDGEVIVENEDESQGQAADAMNGLDLEDREPEIKAFIPGRDQLGEDEELVNDGTAYETLHNLEVEWPCLSFDILKDGLGQQRITYPMTVYVVSGTQADHGHNNKLLVMKMSQLPRTKHDESDEDEDDDEDDDEEDTQDDPVLEYKYIKHEGTVNRVRAMPQGTAHIVATWSDLGKVHLWDLSTAVQALDGPVTGVTTTSLSVTQPIHTFAGHNTEGYSIDWSPTVAGRLVTGDCDKNIYLWNMNNQTASWTVNKKPLSGHEQSVEDLQWSPVEKDILASCSADQTIKVWDVRKKSPLALSVHAHKSDVNVISWNRTASHLMLSGADDGSFAVWDLRNFKADSPAALFKWHTAPITSVEWHPTDESVLAVAGADNQITLWDLSLEKDAEVEGGKQEVDVPAQLLFVHQGQTDIKELHWHKQIPGLIVSTAMTGFNVFKTISA